MSNTNHLNIYLLSSRKEKGKSRFSGLIQDPVIAYLREHVAGLSEAMVVLHQHHHEQVVNRVPL